MDGNWTYFEAAIVGQAWHLYNAFFGVFFALGAHYYAVSGVLIHQYMRMRQTEHPVGLADEVRGYAVKTGGMIIVIFLFWLPSQYVTYSTQTLMGKPKDILSVELAGDYPTPLAIGAAHKLLKAITGQLISVVSLDDSAVREFINQSTLNLDDPELRYELSEFVANCYRPAHTAYRTDHRAPEVYDHSEGHVQKYSGYIGNDYFLNTQGYYRTCSDMSACTGTGYKMPAHLAQRYGIRHEQSVTFVDRHTGQNKTVIAQNPPSCYTWWTGKADHDYDISGLPAGYTPLHDKLRQAAEDQLGKRIVSKAAADTHIAKMLYNNNTITSTVNPPASDRSWWESTKEWISVAVSSALAKGAEIFLAVALKALIYALPIIHSLILFAYILFLTFAVPLSGFAPGYAARSLVHLIYIMLLPLMWVLAEVLNSGLLKLLYPTQMDGETVVYITASVDTGMTTTVIGVVTIMLYVWLPLYLRSIFSSLGDKISDSTDALVSASKSAGSAGAGNIANKAGRAISAAKNAK